MLHLKIYFNKCKCFSFTNKTFYCNGWWKKPNNEDDLTTKLKDIIDRKKHLEDLFQKGVHYAQYSTA